jgi:hypothetical protein
MGPVAKLEQVNAEWLRPSLYLDQDFRELRLAEQAREEVCPRRREENAAASSTLDEITQGHLGLLLSNRPKHVMVMGIKSGSSKPKDSKASAAIEEGERPFEILGPDGKPARATPFKLKKQQVLTRQQEKPSPPSSKGTQGPPASRPSSSAPTCKRKRPRSSALSRAQDSKSPTPAPSPSPQKRKRSLSLSSSEDQGSRFQGPSFSPSTRKRRPSPPSFPSEVQDSAQISADSKEDLGMAEKEKRERRSLKQFFEDGKCIQCGVSVPNIGTRAACTWRFKHLSKCLGMCDRCRDQNLVCSLLLWSKTCYNCSEAGVKCCRTMSETQIREHFSLSGTCSRCGHFEQAVHIHEVKCGGKCQPCANANVPCTAFHSGRCGRCRELRRPCGGRVTHANLKKSKSEAGKRVECDRCGQEISIHSDAFKRHRAYCQGKCEGCQKQRIPCVFVPGQRQTPDTSSCMNCKKQGWKCTGRITHTQEATGSMKLCPRCGVSFRDWGASFKHHEVRCRGRCTRCRDLGLDGEKITGGGCQPCQQAKVSCSGGVTHKNVAILSHRPRQK